MFCRFIYVYLQAKYVGDFEGIENEIARDFLSASKILAESTFKYDSAVAAINSPIQRVQNVTKFLIVIPP